MVQRIDMARNGGLGWLRPCVYAAFAVELYAHHKPRPRVGAGRINIVWWWAHCQPGTRCGRVVVRRVRAHANLNGDAPWPNLGLMGRKKITPIGPTELIDMEQVEGCLRNHKVCKCTTGQLDRIGPRVGQCAPHAHKRSVWVELHRRRVVESGRRSNQLDYR